MAGDSLANTLSFLGSQITGNRQIPAAPQSFLESARNPNIRNFAPGQEPQFQNPMLALLMGGAGKNAGQGGAGLALSGAPQQQGGSNILMRALGLDNVEGQLGARQQQIDDILRQAQ